jgi:hypothetical protein
MENNFVSSTGAEGDGNMRTITMKEIKEMNCSTFSKKDNSPRGIATIYKNELQIGDKVVIENYFTEIIE